MLLIYNLGCNGALLERIELEFVVSLAQCWYINVVHSIQQHRTIQLLRPCYLSYHFKPSWAHQTTFQCCTLGHLTCTHLWGLFSQFLTVISSVWCVLHGISCWIHPACFGGSAVPSRLYNSPLPSGKGKKMEPCVKEESSAY